jgi:hypothetical protein
MANGGGDAVRWVDVAPERLATWLETFAGRHAAAAVPATGPAPLEAAPAPPGVTVAGVTAETVTYQAPDGTQAECHVPFPPLPAPGGAPGPELLAAHAAAPRTVAVFLVRLGGYAAGVFTGEVPLLAASKVGARLVHGRSAAGGQSQQRFARRREKQASEALGAAASTAAAVFEPYASQLEAVVLGGDRRTMAGLRDDPRLRPYFALATERFLTVPDPRLTVLRATPAQFRAIRIRLTAP